MVDAVYIATGQVRPTDLLVDAQNNIAAPGTLNDAVGLVHVMVLRVRAKLLPVDTLVPSGH